MLDQVVIAPTKMQNDQLVLLSLDFQWPGQEENRFQMPLNGTGETWNFLLQ